jgi:hypothetical protein
LRAVPSAFLPHIARVAHEARILRGLSYAHIAVLVVKPDGTAGVSESTIARFEHAEHWPKDPDATISAYAQALEIPAAELWQKAIDRWRGSLAHNPYRDALMS